MSSIRTKHLVMWNKKEQNVITRLDDFWKNSLQVIVKLQCMQNTIYDMEVSEFQAVYFLIYSLFTRSDIKQIF